MFDIKNIKDPQFIKDLNNKELNILAEEIRSYLIENISKTGGHLASNLGVVELTIALYKVFDYEKDSFLFDVGHQSYVHKILTGRASNFDTLRKYNGLSGYINKKESIYDIWESGHSSTSISAMAGLMLANGANSDSKIISIIGDASIVNGISLEALNYIGSLKEKGYSPIIILNDNKMGISKSVGALSKVFNDLRSKTFLIKFKRFCVNHFPTFIVNFFHRIKEGIKGLIQHDNIFEDLGFDYYGPVNGHDIKTLTNQLNRIKKLKCPAVLHVITTKGKGYKFSENDSDGLYHGVEPFDINTGKPLKVNHDYISYSDIFAYALTKLRQNNDFYVITPATSIGSKLQEFSKVYPESFIDVGIAEEHATILASGLALGNKKSILVMYSTFAQRAYDYFLNDVCRQDLPIVIALDRAGVVGQDGQTHAGIYDVAMFQSMPNIYITMAKDSNELIGLLHTSLSFNHPIVIRYPRLQEKIDIKDLEFNKTPLSWEYIINDYSKTVITYGRYVNICLDIIKKHNLKINLINARIIKPLDMNIVNELINKNCECLTIEEVIKTGSLYEKLSEYIENIEGLYFDVDVSLKHGTIEEVLKDYGFDYDSLEERLLKFGC